MNSLLREYANTNESKFSRELLSMRENDNILDYLIDISKALEAIDGVTFLDGKIETDESKFPVRKISTRKTEKGKVKNPDQFWRDIKESRLNLVTLKFELTNDNLSEIIEVPLYVPKLINGSSYLLNGNNYYAVYQLVDSSTYNNKDTVTLKSLLMPIVVRRSGYKFEDVEGNEYNVNMYLAVLFKCKLNIFLYYFCEMGFQKTLEYFDMDKSIKIEEGEIPSSNTKSALIFPIGKSVYIKASRKRYEKDVFFRHCLSNLINVLSQKNRMTLDKIYDEEGIYWKQRLGQCHTTNTSNQVSKAESIIVSFKRILDNCTKRNLRIDPEDKEDTFAIIRWITRNFNKLLKKDNLSLLTKRIRLSEYICAPFSKKLSNSTYRLLNSKNITLAKKKTIFSNIGKMTIIRNILTMDLIRYNNSVNDNDLFTTKLKFSNRGPQSQSEGGGKSVSIHYRGVHPSQIGRLDLCSCSNSDPGKLIASV